MTRNGYVSVLADCSFPRRRSQRRLIRFYVLLVVNLGTNLLWSHEFWKNLFQMQISYLISGKYWLRDPLILDISISCDDLHISWRQIPSEYPKYTSKRPELLYRRKSRYKIMTELVSHMSKEDWSWQFEKHCQYFPGTCSEVETKDLWERSVFSSMPIFPNVHDLLYTFSLNFAVRKFRNDLMNKTRKISLIKSLTIERSEDHVTPTRNFLFFADSITTFTASPTPSRADGGRGARKIDFSLKKTPFSPSQLDGIDRCDSRHPRYGKHQASWT